MGSQALHSSQHKRERTSRAVDTLWFSNNCCCLQDQLGHQIRFPSSTESGGLPGKSGGQIFSLRGECAGRCIIFLLALSHVRQNIWCLGKQVNPYPQPSLLLEAEETHFPPLCYAAVKFTGYCKERGLLLWRSKNVPVRTHPQLSEYQNVRNLTCFFCLFVSKEIKA